MILSGRVGGFWYLVLAGLIAVMAPLHAKAEYLVSPGDTIEVRVAGVTELSQRAQVQQDGSVSLAGLGDISVGGLGLADMRASIRAAVARKVLWERSPDGQQHIVAIDPDDVTIGIAEYQPVYVSGDVLTPGKHAFLPSMTVRQAIALSGGYAILKSSLLGSADPLEVQSEYASVGAQLAKEHVHATRLRAELDGKRELGPVSLGDIPVPGSTLAELLRAEGEAMRISAGDYELQRTLLLSAIERSKAQLAELQADVAEQNQGLKSDQQDLQTALKAYARGIMTNNRVADDRHAVSAAATRLLEINSNINQTKQELDNFTLNLVQLETHRRLSLLDGISQSRIALVELWTKFKTLRQRMEVLGSPADSIRSESSEFFIVRRFGNDWKTIPASLETELQPGDVVTVHVKSPPQGADDSAPAYRPLAG